MLRYKLMTVIIVISKLGSRIALYDVCYQRCFRQLYMTPLLSPLGLMYAELDIHIAIQTDVFVSFTYMRVGQKPLDGI